MCIRKVTAAGFKTTLILITLFSQTLRAADIEASVIVSPVGDFVAEFKDIDMPIAKNKDSYQTSGVVLIPWSKVSTGMSLRDTHTKKYFNADKYPNIEISSSLGKAGKGVAKVKMNGVEKIVKGTYEVKGKKMISEVKLKLSEFNVKNINFKGAGVQDDVTIKVTADIN